MERRKVQLTGKSSYIITLPKEWVLAHGIKKNDAVGVEITTDGNLIIIPKIEERKVRKIKVIKVDSTTDPSLLFRLLVSAYIIGHSEIRVEGNLTTEHRKFVRKFAKMAIGEEIIEEEDKHIVIKDLLDPHEMPLDKSVKRMQVITENMILDAIRSMKTGNRELAKDVIQRDDEVDRLHWLISRQYSMMIRNVGTARIMGVTPWEGLNYFLISRYLERIGDHAARIAKYSMEIMGVDDDFIECVEKGAQVVINTLKSSVNAFLRGNIEIANDNINAMAEISKICEKIYTSALNYTGKMAMSIGYVAESLRRIGEYSADICERAINMWAEKETNR